jgi:2-keto-4-pentenoate hydratase/2-oxohepta-3-ene-1,7-dioic acid hydratase in catechol pathway
MRLANVDGRAAVVIDGRVADVESLSGGSLGPDPMDLVDLANHDTLRALTDGLVVSVLPDLDEASLGPPVPRPGKVIAMALNYRSHAEEADKALPDQPHVMVKFPTCICGPYDDVHMHDLEMVDYEAELVIAIGKEGKRIAESDAWSHVSGLMAGNDVSDRNEQFRPPIKQFSMAKSYDEFGPIGPFLVTPDDVPDPEDLGLELTVDGELRQRSRTGDFIFSIPVLLAWLSRYVTLEVGDLIFTGTPGGVGDSMSPPVYLEDGQVVETTIEGIGSLRNRFVAGDL